MNEASEVGGRQSIQVAPCKSEKCAGKYTWQVRNAAGKLECGNCGNPYTGTAFA